MDKYEAPVFEQSAFNCPYCGAYAHQSWKDLLHMSGTSRFTFHDLRFATCRHCAGKSIWYERKMVIPTDGSAPPPSPDLPEHIKLDYREACSIMARSPKGAAALLRLAIQKLCKHLGEKGKNLNDDIGNLVKKGLPVKVQQSLDIVRVIGNNAVHPGQIDLNDTPETTEQMFGLVNIITDVMISQPKEIEKLYQNLPEAPRDAIGERDRDKSAEPSGS